MATNKRQSIVVEQYYNHSFTKAIPKDMETNPEHVYKVIKTVNTLRVSIGETITPNRAQQLMDMDIDVTIQPVR